MQNQPGRGLPLNECQLGVCGGFSSILPVRGGEGETEREGKAMASKVSVVNATAKSIGDAQAEMEQETEG